MTHFGMLCPALPGHLNPMMALGRELKRRGHDLTFFQIPDVKSKILAEGFNFHPIGQDVYPPGSLKKFLAHLGKLKGPPAIIYWHQDHQQVAGVVCRDAPKAIQKAGVEALLIDQLEPGGAAVAERLQLPFITICNALALNREPGIPPIFTHWVYQEASWVHLRNQVASYLSDLTVQPFHVVVARYRRQWKLPPLKGSDIFFANSQLAQISQQPTTFDFPRQFLPKCFHYTGPWRNQSAQVVPFPWERLTDKPLIYASLGTLQISKYDVFHCIAAACEPLDVQLVITHGGGMNEEQAQKLPGSPLVVSYAPQLEVLAKATLAITHAGLNTVLDALSYGVPLVAIPITFEQPGIAARLQWTGAGQMLPVSRLSVSRLRTAIQQVLTEKSYRQNAERLRDSLRQAGGVVQAADIVERVIETGKPVLADN
ncbi:glycosyltransferase, MGT family [Pleurocapsa sp. PCC 7327]|uniref:glycosyltransferase n=1 Tax=Pleurocapsa sp. PCC 7327 TaxID=118163 RepID=UPI00029FA8F4|nr:glycosyltransferase [Pleurocapsa sp. PCC 7327]AFY75970.1 glycosyltransferase, MGT family [Pleurocapsa sp. PCC 7327]